MPIVLKSVCLNRLETSGPVTGLSWDCFTVFFKHNHWCICQTYQSWDRGFPVKPLVKQGKIQLKCDGTWWRRGREVKGKLANGVGSQYSSHYLGTRCIQHYYRWYAQIGYQQSTELTPTGRFKWTLPFRRKTKCGFCACAITFQLASTGEYRVPKKEVPSTAVLKRNELAGATHSSQFVLCWRFNEQTAKQEKTVASN